MLPIFFFLQTIKFVQQQYFKQQFTDRIYIHYSMIIVLFSIIFFLTLVSSEPNFISNGAFDLPTVPRNFLADSRADSWAGELFQVYNYGAGLGYGQYMDLQNQKGNGYIQQTIQLPCEAYYILSFYRKSSDTNYASHVLEIYWNGMFIQRITPQEISIVKESIQVLGHLGKNLLRIVQVGVGDDYEGLLIDELTLTKSNNLLVRQQVYAVSFLISTPLNQFVSIRNALLFADDLFLYSFDIVKYKGLLAIIFNTVTTIEVLKFEVLDKFLGWMQYTDTISDTGKKYYSKKAFVNIDGAFKIPVDAFFPYLVYTIPQTILTCVIFFLIFHMTKEYKISKLFRKFSFFKFNLIKLLLQQNVAYFSYICLGNMTELFSFDVDSKWFNLFSIGVLFALVFYTVTFYFFVGRYLGSKSSYFVACAHHNSASLMFMCFGLLRCFTRGAIHLFFREQYGYQTAALCLLQIITLVYFSYTQSKNKLYDKKIVFSLIMLYHFLFFLFNLVLYLNFKTKIQGPLDSLQQDLIYCLLGTTFLATIFEIIPLKKCSRNVNASEEIVQANESNFADANQKQTVLTKFMIEQGKKDEKTNNKTIQVEKEDQKKTGKQAMKPKTPKTETQTSYRPLNTGSSLKKGHIRNKNVRGNSKPHAEKQKKTNNLDQNILVIQETFKQK